MNPYDLTGRVALVTGGGVGIGRAVVLALAQAGARVGIHYHSSADEAAATLAAVEQAGGQGLLIGADLTDESSSSAVVDRVAAQFGRLDVLVNNAGSPLERSAIADCSTDLWRRAFAVNVDSAFFVTRRAIPHLKAGGCGAIVNVLSLSVQTGAARAAGLD